MTEKGNDKADKANVDITAAFERFQEVLVREFHALLEIWAKIEVER